MALMKTQGTAIQPILLLVRWQAACHDCHGQKPDECVQDDLLATIGFFVQETDTQISISHEVWVRDGTFRHITHIPLCLIQELLVLNVARVDPQGCA